ncbi:MAG: GIY-YIG nuclease family protein [Syntrophorhabdaceae bacterium]|nr:GIY-YIG nuclease family protein [Syntrophorhabdaceae bacterium]MDD5244781.1 GIY-YIG nuclease family protein [Syntrophorhabdaceae bacterium]
MKKQYYVYIMTNQYNKVLYTGVTSDLKKRVFQHKEKLIDGFSKRYNIVKLVYYEVYDDPENAILREKQLKSGTRHKKVDLINTLNMKWTDLYNKI